MAYCTLLVGWILAEKGLFAEDIATPHYVSNLLLAVVGQCYHQASIEHKVDVVNIITLLEQDLVLVHNSYLGALNDEFVRIVADLGQYFMMQPDPLQTEYLLVLLLILTCFDKVTHKNLHVAFSIIQRIQWTAVIGLIERCLVIGHIV